MDPFLFTERRNAFTDAGFMRLDLVARTPRLRPVADDGRYGECDGCLTKPTGAFVTPTRPVDEQPPTRSPTRTARRGTDDDECQTPSGPGLPDHHRPAQKPGTPKKLRASRTTANNVARWRGRNDHAFHVSCGQQLPGGCLSGEKPASATFFLRGGRPLLKLPAGNQFPALLGISTYHSRGRKRFNGHLSASGQENFGPLGGSEKYRTPNSIAWLVESRVGETKGRGRLDGRPQLPARRGHSPTRSQILNDYSEFSRR